MVDGRGAADVRALAAAAGIEVFALANVADLVARLDAAGWFPEPRPGSGRVLPALTRALPDPLSGSVLACAFPYACDRPEDRGEPSASAGDLRGQGLIAPFARRNYYRAAVKTLQSIARRAGGETGAPRRAFRIFVNSRVPEKLIAYGAGLGWYGKNRLLFTGAYGSRFVIGLIFLPWRIAGEAEWTTPSSPADRCGACEACLEACPVNALRAGADLSGCLKSRSDAREPWDESVRRAWGVRLYGCDTCQAVCPQNRRPVPVAALAVAGGAIGPGVDLAFLLSLSETERRIYFKKTALGMSWILPEALLRNGLCAAGNAGAPDLLPAVRNFLGDARPLLADMARWAAERIVAGGGRESVEE